MIKGRRFFHIRIFIWRLTRFKGALSKWPPPSKVRPIFIQSNPAFLLDTGKSQRRAGELSPTNQGGGGGQAPIPGSDLLNLFLPPSQQNQNSIYVKKGVDPARVKQDIVKALADPGLSKDIVQLADELLERKR